LDANDWLSVQVHPDEKAVAKLWPGEGSKTEAWFVIDAAPGSRVYAGLLPGVDEKRLRSALAAGEITDCLHSFEPRPGDCVFLPAGTVHAVGGGVLMAEIQQTSDATFRLFDWNRRDDQGMSRPLHIEESLASIHWNQGPVNPVHVAELIKPSNLAKKQDLVRCPFFELTYWKSSEPVHLAGQGRLQALIILQGRGRWHGSSCSEELNMGQVWVLPASIPPLECQPDPSLTMLLVTLP
jgi:mannose-6-phosphate isomerase